MRSIKIRYIVYLLLIKFTLLMALSDNTRSSLNDIGIIGKTQEKSGYGGNQYGGGGGHQRSQVYFGGQYGGRCGKDGFYYNDNYSFVTCSHGIAYIQRCAPGTRNGAMESYSSGGYYSHTSFCDVNLVDYGYAAYHSRRRPRKKSHGGYGGSHGSTTGRSYGNQGGHYGSYGQAYGQSYGRGYGASQQYYGGYNTYGRGSQGYGQSSRDYTQSYRPRYR